MYIQLADYNEKKYLDRYKIFKLCPPILYKYIIGKEYKKIYNKKLNLRNPQKLSEKLQWLKLYDKNPLKTRLTDKILLKEYIKENIPDLKTAKIYKIFNTAEEIDFTDLPKEFIIKTNHSWKTNIYIEDKNKITKEKLEEYKEYYKQALKINYAYWSFFELQYKDIKPKVFAEEFYGDLYATKQYEIYCFNGNPEFIVCGMYKIESNYSNYKQYIYNENWEKLNFNIENEVDDSQCIKPAYLVKMIESAKILSKNSKFVRVDFAENENDIYLNEVTFTPYSGFVIFYAIIDMDLYYGNKLILRKDY